MKLFFREFGEGKPIIILHGLFGISDNWVSFGKELAEKGYKVYIPDQRNHGQSPHSVSFNYLAMVDDLYEFIEEHELEQPIIMGHSMGGKVCMRFSLENPEMTDRIIIIDISMRSYPPRIEHKKIIDAMRRVNFGMVSSRKEVDMLLSERLPDDRLRMFIMKNLYWKEKDQLDWRLNFEGICDNLDDLFDGIEVVDQYEKQALFIRGGDSDYINKDDILRIDFNFPHNKLITIENASHWVHADNPEKFREIVFAFLEDQ